MPVPLIKFICQFYMSPSLSSELPAGLPPPLTYLRSFRIEAVWQLCGRQLLKIACEVPVLILYLLSLKRGEFLSWMNLTLAVTEGPCLDLLPGYYNTSGCFHIVMFLTCRDPSILSCSWENQTNQMGCVIESERKQGHEHKAAAKVIQAKPCKCTSLKG